ncbi:MAG: chemotaxis protein CheB [Steroidobacteraceae bacterium]
MENANKALTMACPIVAIGASAGGLEAISELLAALPSTNAMAYVVIQHLDPEHKSLLPEILSKKTDLPVETIHEDLTVEPGRVYVMPQNVTLTLSDDRFHLTARGGGRHHPIDAFFISLAEVCADAAIGVILSGADADGTLGVQAIKHGGGITFAQTPESARFGGMPRSAIESDCVDFVLAPREIARELTRLGHHPYLVSPGRPPEEPADANEEGSLRRIFRRLRAVHGVDFTYYKRSTLRRRLGRRMALRKLEELAAYVALLEGDVDETAALYQDFLIRVTGFFRDPESFEGLRQRVFPNVCEGRSLKEPIRIWVPGCATGEEVYSIGIALMEHLGEHSSAAGIQIFGTDVSEAAIEKARAALYLDTITQEVSSERLRRFFVKEDHHYRIAKSLRDVCIFARQDVTRDPPFSRLDLVSCRNLLIYLDAAAQRRVMQVFHYSLRAKGFLLLGPSENVGTAADFFELHDKRHRIYSRKAVAAGTGLELGAAGAPRYGRLPGVANEQATGFPEVDSAQREADRLLLARFAPASLLVDEALNILQVRGETGRYLQLASGQPSLNLHRVVRPELLVELVPAIQQARESGAETRREGLRVDQRRDLTIEVIPLKRVGTERCYLILFDDGSRTPSGRREQGTASRAMSESEKDRRLEQLAREVATTRDYLQATMEDHEAVKEELKSAHEEVLSANEEFQSTNEELETAKEELQSANEELTTTNDELRNRNRELSVLNSEVQKGRETAERARGYADAIINAVRDPLIVLDSNLEILRANGAFYANFKLRREETEGRSLSKLDGGQWNVPELVGSLREVLTRNAILGSYDLRYNLPDALLPQTLRVNARKIPGDGERAELLLLAVEDAEAEQLRETMQRKDEFLAMLGHELRNPLTPIAHAIHLLRRGVTSTPPEKVYDLIGRQTARLIRLVDQLLDVARISRGHIELKRETVDLVDVVQQAVDAFRPRLDERQHELSMMLPEAPVHVSGDPVRLEQIVANLLENAAKYTEPGGRIKVQLWQESGEAILSVHDNGIGLAAENLEKVFDLFTQINPSVARTAGGLGIGLTLVRRMLGLHGGTVEAHSAGLGQGAQFIVRLPIVWPQSTPQAKSQRDTNSPGQLAQARRVLIVDDNVDSGDSLALVIRSWGHEVAVARDGPAALALADKFRPECALVDIGLPGMNGYQLGRRLREAHRHLYLVALTGYGRDEDRKTAHAAGFDRHLVKPADLEELQDLLANGGLKAHV